MSRVEEIIRCMNHPVPPYVPKPRGPIYFIEDIIRHMYKDAPDDVIADLREKNKILPYVAPKFRVKKKKLVPVEPVFEKPVLKKRKKILKAVVKKN